MAKLSPVRTVIRILGAFAREPTQRQDTLAKKLEVKIDTLVDYLREMKEEGLIPLEDSKDHRHIYWSTPSAFSIRGLLIPNSLVEPYLRVLHLSPPGDDRDKLLDYARRAMPHKIANFLEPGRLLVSELDSEQAEMFSTMQAAIAKNRSLFVRYDSKSEDPNNATTRVVSPHIIDVGEKLMVIAWCHRLKALKWFRLDRFKSARDETRSVPFHRVSDDELEEFLDDSEGQFHGGGPRKRYEFTILKPTADWAGHRLTKRMRPTFTDKGVDVVIETTAVRIVARFIIGLGGDVVVHTPELRAACLALAESSVAALRR